MYIIQRDDGKFVAPPGQEKSYTLLLQEAWTFETREGAEAEICPANERVVNVDDLFPLYPRIK